MEAGKGVHTLIYNVYAMKRILTHKQLVVKTLPGNYVQLFIRKKGFDFLQKLYFSTLASITTAENSHSQLRLFKYLTKAMIVVLKR